MIKKYLLQILPSFIIISLFFIFFYSPSNKAARKEIQELNLINKRLKKSNDSIRLEIVQYKDDMAKSDEIIMTLMEEDHLLRDEVNELTDKITNLKSKYEKANTHANGFDSSAIKQYFSNL